MVADVSAVQHLSEANDGINLRIRRYYRMGISDCGLKLGNEVVPSELVPRCGDARECLVH